MCNLPMCKDDYAYVEFVAECRMCSFRWWGEFPDGLASWAYDSLECPKCHNLTGGPDD